MATSKTSTARKPAAKKPAAPKPAAKKTTATGKVTAKTTAKTATVKKPATTLTKTAVPAAAKKPATRAKAAPRKKADEPTPEQRYKMVQDAAYFIAEKNGFVSGSMDYWIEAEAEIAAMLSGKVKK